jgi:hypothetical protein
MSTKMKFEKIHLLTFKDKLLEVFEKDGWLLLSSVDVSRLFDLPKDKVLEVIDTFTFKKEILNIDNVYYLHLRHIGLVLSEILPLLTPHELVACSNFMITFKELNSTFKDLSTSEGLEEVDSLKDSISFILDAFLVNFNDLISEMGRKEAELLKQIVHETIKYWVIKQVSLVQPLGDVELVADFNKIMANVIVDFIVTAVHDLTKEDEMELRGMSLVSINAN